MEEPPTLEEAEIVQVPNLDYPTPILNPISRFQYKFCVRFSPNIIQLLDVNYSKIFP